MRTTSFTCNQKANFDTSSGRHMSRPTAAACKFWSNFAIFDDYCFENAMNFGL